MQAYSRMQYAMFLRHPGLDYTTSDGEDHMAERTAWCRKGSMSIRSGGLFMLTGADGKHTATCLWR